MAAPRLKGLHHIKLPVTDLDTSLNWYRRVFDAEHLTRFDHYDGAGTRYAVILQLPGVEVPIELRWTPDAATATAGYDPVHFVAGGADDLQVSSATWSSARTAAYLRKHITVAHIR